MPKGNAALPNQTMDFFGRQDRARKNTSLLVILFILGTLTVTALVVVVVSLAAMALSNGQAFNDGFTGILIVVGSGIGTILFMGAASGIKISQLGSGGSIRGGSHGREIPIKFNNQSPEEKQLLNIVSEMSIASGVPVPAGLRDGR